MRSPPRRSKTPRYDSHALRIFAGIDLGLESVPDATTLLKFRRLLETHDLTRRLLGEVTALLTEKKLILREGTLMDATIIAAPPSTKNRSGQRDPEMHRTKKGQQWYFGMKAHIGADDAHGLVHTVEGTAANVSGLSQAHALLHGEEKRAGADCRLYRSGKAARNHRAGPEDPLAHRGQTQPPCQRA